MLFRDASLAALLLALAAASRPVVRERAPSASPRAGPTTLDLDFALNLNLTHTNLAELGRARAASKLKGVGALLGLGRRDGAIAATNTAVTYVAQVGVGEPATNYSLIVDTGSSNTWVGASKKYAPTGSSVDVHKNVSVSYGSGHFTGKEYNDTVTFSPGLVVKDQSIGVATSNNSVGFSGYDGILGLGPVAMTANTVEGVDKVPTVADNLAAQGAISTEVVGVSFAPTTNQPNTNGVLTFGGVDPSKHTGDIAYTPITKNGPASQYWGIDQSIAYGAANTTIMKSASGIVDTGSTLLLLASDFFNAYKNATGAEEDSATGLLKIAADKYDKLESLYFGIGGATFELTKNAQTFPRALNSYISGDKDTIYLVVGDLGYNSGSGLDFINGLVFLERFYSVYDTTNQRVGFATTANTNATIN
ncbi:acid protease [Phellopilus nigrolimitatus]|nr:acid protease [Phellopilus nigrolimitatus]